jgi:hypothetical protein
MSGLDAPEALVVGLATEATLDRARTAAEGIGGFVEQFDRAVEQAAEFDHVADQLVREAAGFDAERAVFSISSATFAKGSAPNWRASPLMVCAGMTRPTVFSWRMACSMADTDFIPSSRK